MADDAEQYEFKFVRTMRAREARTRSKWQRRGWDFVSQSQGRLRTDLTFRRAKPTKRRNLVAVSIGLVLLLGVGAAVTTRLSGTWSDGSDPQDAPVVGAAPSGDSDGDGLPDDAETTGWRTQGVGVFITDPDNPDSDGDGLTDGDEAGALVASASAENVYDGYSNPHLPDTDRDGLVDADEADLGLDAFDRDSDDDQLYDGYEVQIVGSAPDTADTDGDGFEDAFEDANRDSQGLDPLWVDVKVDKWTYVADFAKGAGAGDLWREDSLAWLAGNLTSGAASSFPVFGSVIGAGTDVRDAVGSAIRADWVGSGFSAVGAVPGGDVVAIPGKAARFVARNPELAAATAAMIVLAAKIPDAVKISATKKIWKDWDDLVAAGASDKALLRLQEGRTSLDDVAANLKRSTPVVGPEPKFFAWQDGERYLEDYYGESASGVSKQVRASTEGCVEVCDSKIRIFDVFADGVAHESKVGHVAWRSFTQNQIREDAWLVKSGKIESAHWHFFASARSNTIGADKRVFDLLDANKIPYTIHMPAHS